MYSPRSNEGFTVFFTGLSCAGKSTIANVLAGKILERTGGRVALLDGDVVRKHLSPDLGFSKQDRDLNVRRVGLLASEISKSGGIAICALIAPYDAARKEARRLVQDAGSGFVMVHVATPLAVCEQRDRKGLYSKAREGEISQFTGISDPYEVPSDAELVIDSTDIAPAEAAQIIADYLEREGHLARPETLPLWPELAAI